MRRTLSSTSKGTLPLEAWDAAPLKNELAEPPRTVIKRRRGWRSLNPAELWNYREVLFFLTWRDIKVRYTHWLLGALWAILQPLGIMVVMSLFLSRLAATTATDIPYPLYVYAGLLPWTFFANSILTASQSIVTSQSLVTKIYFPRLIIPMGALGANLLDFAVAFSTLPVLMLIYGISPSWSILWAPLIILSLLIAALGAGALFSALTVAYRDFRYVVPFLLQLWLFSTPCSYLPVQALRGSRWHALLPLNPANGLIANFRQALLGGELDVQALAVSGSVSLVLFFAGCQYFRQVERSFADII